MYLVNVERVAGQSAGAMSGVGGRKLLLHSTEGTTIEGAIAAYRARNVWPHLTVDCPRRRGVQHLPLDVAARSLRNKAGGVETNRAGKVLVQIEMVGFAGAPESIGSAADLDWFGREVVRPIHERMGVPLETRVTWRPYPASYGELAPQRVPAAAWAGLDGLVGHQHAPENDHGDPGALPVARILAAASNQLLQEDDVTPAELRATLNDTLIYAITEPGHPFRAEFARLVDSRLAIKKIATRDDANLDAAEVTALASAVATEIKIEVTSDLAADEVEAAVEAAVRRVFADAGTD